jgi:hypothetical protein
LGLLAFQQVDGRWIEFQALPGPQACFSAEKGKSEGRQQFEIA